MRHLAITGMVTASMIAAIRPGSLIRATPPSRRMSAGTRSRAMTATAPASSAILACSGVTTSIITPPRSISARPRLTRSVPVCRSMPLSLGAAGLLGGGRCAERLHPDPRRALRHADRCPGGVVEGDLGVRRRLGPMSLDDHALGEHPRVTGPDDLSFGNRFADRIYVARTDRVRHEPQ